MKSPVATIFSSLSTINPYAVVRKTDLVETLNLVGDLAESLRSVSAGRWITAADVDDTTNIRWKMMKQQAMAAYVADTIVKRIIDVYTEWCLAGGIKYSVNADAGWAAATIRRLWPNGFFDFFGEVIFYWGVFGEFYFRPNISPYGTLHRFELISPLEIIDMRQDTIDKTVYFKRIWQDISISTDGTEMLMQYINSQKVYTSNECLVIKWNSPGNRGIPFVHPIIAWILMYNEWLKDRAVTNRMRSFAYLKRKITKPSGTVKSIADKLSSQLMKSDRYQPGRHDQWGYGYKKEKMPIGGILTCDAYTDWEALNFQVQGDDAAPDGHAFRQQVCALSGIPEGLLFNQADARLDTADSRVESFSRKIEYLRTMFSQIVNDILDHCRKVELVMNGANPVVREAGRRISTKVNFSFKPSAVGERRFYAEDATKSMVAGILSRQTAMEMSPFSGDAEVEEGRIRKESNDEMTQGFLDRISKSKMQDNRDDENTDLRTKEKDGDAGVRGQEYDNKKKTGKES